MISNAETPTAGPSPSQARRKLVKDISYFLIGMGIVFGAMGLAAYLYIPPQGKPILGVARHIVFGAPLLGLGGTQLLCGILFVSTNKSAFAVIGVIAGGLISVMAFVLTGVTLVNGLLAAGPLLVAQRLSVLAKQQDAPPTPPSEASKVG
jgi:hypothetical protein